MSKVIKVALLLNTTESKAREFCVAVQKEFKGTVPPFSIIADCLEQHISAKDTPTELARIIKLAHPHVISPPLPKQINKPKRRKGKSPSGGGNAGGDTLSTISPIMAHDPREFTENLPKCPHGVLKIRKCAICDPEGFRLEYGWD